MWGAILGGPILGPLLSLISINDLHVGIKYFEVHHIAYNANLLTFNSRVKSINKQINYDLKNLSNWLKANKISQNVDKTRFENQTKWKKVL